MEGVFSMIVWTVVVAVMLYVIQLPLRRKAHPRIRTAVFVIKMLLIPATALLFVAVDWPAAYLHGDILTAIYIALCGDVVSSIVEYAVRRIRETVKHTEKSHICLLGLCGVLAALCTAGVFIGGWADASSISRTDLDITSDRAAKAHTFAFVSDIHGGDAHPVDIIRDLCRQMNEQSPEFVILGGDITDEMTSYEEMTEVYRILSELEAPVYFVYGNHDRQPGAQRVGGRTYTDEELKSAIEGAGFTILKDDYVQIDEDLVLLGREDVSRGEERSRYADLTCPYEGMLIVADHQPYDEEQLAEEVSTLQISGHSHAGQLFPLQAVYRILGLPAYGSFRYAGTQLYVSSGAGLWGTPIRTEERCEWVLVTIRPE